MLIPPIVFSSAHSADAMLCLVTLCLSVLLGLVSPVSPCLWCLETWILLRNWALYPTTNTCLVFFSSLQCWSEASEGGRPERAKGTVTWHQWFLSLLDIWLARALVPGPDRVSEVSYSDVTLPTFHTVRFGSRLHPMCFSSWGLKIYRIYLKCFC